MYLLSFNDNVYYAFSGSHWLHVLPHLKHDKYKPIVKSKEKSSRLSWDITVIHLMRKKTYKQTPSLIPSLLSGIRGGGMRKEITNSVKEIFEPINAAIYLYPSSITVYNWLKTHRNWMSTLKNNLNARRHVLYIRNRIDLKRRRTDFDSRLLVNE